MRWLLFTFWLFFNTSLTASPADSVRYFIPSTGVALVTYRDFATSPLFYSGLGARLALGHQWERPNGEYTVQMAVLGGVANAQVPQSRYFQPSTTGFIVNFNLYSHYLRKVPVELPERLTLRAGGAFVSDFNARFNPQLGNATAGIEAMANLMGVAKLVFDASRRQAVTRGLKRYSFKQKKPVKRQVDFRLNVGMVNLNYRPGYSFVHDSELDGESPPGLAWLLSEHRWKVNGWRLGTELGLTRFRANGHPIRLSYHWDAMHAPGRFEHFQMAVHALRITFMFNTTRIRR